MILHSPIEGVELLMDGSGPPVQRVVQNRDDEKVMPAGQEDNGGIMMDKTSLRKEAKTRLQAMDSDHREKDESICRRLTECVQNGRLHARGIRGHEDRTHAGIVDVGMASFRQAVDIASFQSFIA